MVIATIVSGMLVFTWISLQRAFGSVSKDNTATTTGRYALTRISSELQNAQPPTSSSTTPFIFTFASPYVCDANDCVFYSAYNNADALTQSGSNGEAQGLPTAIWLDTSGSAAQKKLYWRRDTNKNGVLDTGDKTILLAGDVVNTAAAVNRPIFTYVFRDTNGNYTTSTSLASSNVATLVAVNIELVVDANLSHTPTYVDFVSTVRPRNAGTN